MTLLNGLITAGKLLLFYGTGLFIFNHTHKQHHTSKTSTYILYNIENTVVSEDYIHVRKTYKDYTKCKFFSLP